MRDIPILVQLLPYLHKSKVLKFCFSLGKFNALVRIFYILNESLFENQTRKKFF